MVSMRSFFLKTLVVSLTLPLFFSLAKASDPGRSPAVVPTEWLPLEQAIDEAERSPSSKETWRELSFWGLSSLLFLVPLGLWAAIKILGKEMKSEYQLEFEEGEEDASVLMLETDSLQREEGEDELRKAS